MMTTTAKKKEEIVMVEVVCFEKGLRYCLESSLFWERKKGYEWMGG